MNKSIETSKDVAADFKLIANMKDSIPEGDPIWTDVWNNGQMDEKEYADKMNRNMKDIIAAKNNTKVESRWELSRLWKEIITLSWIDTEVRWKWMVMPVAFIEDIKEDTINPSCQIDLYLGGKKNPENLVASFFFKPSQNKLIRL